MAETKDKKSGEKDFSDKYAISGKKLDQNEIDDLVEKLKKEKKK